MDTYIAPNTSAGLLLRIGTLLHEVACMLRALAQRLDARRRAAVALDALTRMSERELRDIGISRSSIRAMVEGLWTRDWPLRVRPFYDDGSQPSRQDAQPAACMITRCIASRNPACPILIPPLRRA